MVGGKLVTLEDVRVHIKHISELLSHPSLSSLSHEAVMVLGIIFKKKKQNKTKQNKKNF
jgi:hypothetical protein